MSARSLKKIRTRLALAEARAVAGSGPSASLTATPGPVGGGTSVAFAKTYEMNNYIPPLAKNERDQLTGVDLRTVWANAERLLSDCPLAYGPLNSVAAYLGPVKPRAATADPGWNQEADAWFDEVYWKRGLWDASRKLSSAEWQHMMAVYHFTHGDVLSVFTHDEEGVPCVRIIPAPSIDSPWEGYGNNKIWRDGVKEGLHHRHEAWHVLASEDAPVNLSAFQRKGYVVTRENGCMIGKFRVGGARGLSALIPTGSTISKMQQAYSDSSNIIALASKIGLSFETDAGQPTSQIKGIGGVTRGQSVPAPVNGASDEVALKRYYEEFVSSGPAVLDPGPGRKINLHNIDREMPDHSAFTATGYERIAAGFGLPASILFMLQSGNFKSTGPEVRQALARAKIWRYQELQKRDPLIMRQYARIIQWALDTKQLRAPKGMIRYWASRTEWAKDPTVDESRSASNDEKLLEMGSTSEQELAAEHGNDWNKVQDERVAYAKALHEKAKSAGLPPEIFFKAWPKPVPAPGSGNNNQSNQAA